MPRNFLRRIETAWPVLDRPLIKRIDQQILPIALSDNVKSWTLNSDGSYQRRTPREGERAVRSQEAFIELARSEAVSSGPYDEIIRRPGSFRRKAKKKKQQHK
jgi:polyphosphate kinase